MPLVRRSFFVSSQTVEVDICFVQFVFWGAVGVHIVVSFMSFLFFFVVLVMNSSYVGTVLVSKVLKSEVRRFVRFSKGIIENLDVSSATIKLYKLGFLFDPLVIVLRFVYIST